MGTAAGRSTDAERRGDDPAPEVRTLTLVIDASIAVPLALLGARPPAIEGESLIAPPLMWSEATSALHELGHRGDIDEPLATRAIGSLLALGIERSDEPRLGIEASRVARTLGWAKTYDAEYVALALMTGARLLTRDARLVRGASRLIVAIGPDELHPREAD